MGRSSSSRSCFERIFLLLVALVALFIFLHVAHTVIALVRALVPLAVFAVGVYIIWRVVFGRR